jgi:hypothetical protein
MEEQRTLRQTDSKELIIYFGQSGFGRAANSRTNRFYRIDNRYFGQCGYGRTANSRTNRFRTTWFRKNSEH